MTSRKEPGSSRPSTASSVATGSAPGTITAVRHGPLPGQPAAADEWDESGAHERRLAAPGRSDDRDQPAVEDARRELGDEPLATDEQVGVLDVVRGQRPVGLAAGPHDGCQLVPARPSGDEAEDVIEHRRPRVRGGDPCADRRGGVRGQPLGGGMLRPRRSLAAGDAGETTGHGHQCRDRLRVDPVRHDEWSHRLVIEGLEGARRAALGREAAQCVERRAGRSRIGDDDQKNSRLGDRGGECGQRGQRPRRAPLGVVDGDEDRLGPALVDHGIHEPAGRVGPDVLLASEIDDVAAVADRRSGQVGHQASPSRVHRAQQQPHLARPGAGGVPRLEKPRPFAAPVRTARRHDDGASPAGSAPVERSVPGPGRGSGAPGRAARSRVRGRTPRPAPLGPAGTPRGRRAGDPPRTGHGSADSSCALAQAAHAPAVRGRRSPARGLPFRAAPRRGPRPRPNGARRVGPPRRRRSWRPPGPRTQAPATDRARLRAWPPHPACRPPRAAAGPLPRAARRRPRRWPRERRRGGSPRSWWR